MTTRSSYEQNKKLLVVNLFGGPSCGKSQTAYKLAGWLKEQGYSVEYVSEYAKDLTWEHWNQALGEQDLIFAKQNRRLRRLVDNGVKVVIQDTSLLHTLVFMPDDFPKSFESFVIDVFNSYDNMNVYLNRDLKIPYENMGRNESYEQALAKDSQMLKMLHRVCPGPDQVGEYLLTHPGEWEALCQAIVKRIERMPE